MTVKPLKKKPKNKTESKLISKKFQISGAVFIIFFAFYLHQIFKLSRFNNLTPKGINKYWLHGNKSKSVFRPIEKVLDRIGFESIEMKFEDGKYIHMDWHLAWTYMHHIDLPINLNQLKPHQKMNHFPGNYMLVTKSNLATSVKSKYIPKAFETYEELDAYAGFNLNKKFMRKHKDNAGITLQTVSEMTFEGEMYENEYFAQEFIDNPLLIAGHKFDFGIFVVITSINPLRLYYYPENLLLRLCTLPFHPFNEEEVNRYVISHKKETRILGADFPAIKKHLINHKTMKRAMEEYFFENSINISKVWSDVEECIRDVALQTEKYFIDELAELDSKRNFFELYRFDFILDEDLNLFLLEANMSPNLFASSKHDEVMNEDVLENLFNLIGLQTSQDKINENDLKPQTKICSEEPCANSCVSEICAVCWQCLDEEKRLDFKMAFGEQSRIGKFKRLVPDINSDSAMIGSINQQHLNWYKIMCRKDEIIC